MSSIFFECGYIFYLNKKIKEYDVFENYNHYQVLTHYKANLTNQENDVVFIGDSSCLQGVRPKIIEQRTGLKVVNLALYGFSGPQAYDVILRRYLKNNKPPKLIIYYFSPAIPNFYNKKYFEKIYVCIKYFNLRNFLLFFDQVNPFFDFPYLADYLSKISSVSGTQYNPFKLYQETKEEKGYNITLPDGTIPIQGLSEDHSIDSRAICPEIIGTQDDPLFYLNKIKKEHSSENTKVLFYIAPMTNKEKSFEYYKKVYENIYNNSPYTLPNKLFRDYTHLLEEGANVNSEIVALFLMENL